MSRKVFFVNSARTWGGGEKWHFHAATFFNGRCEVVGIVAPGSALAQRMTKAGLGVVGVPIGNLSFLNPLKLLRLYLQFRSTDTAAVILNLPSDVKLAGVAARLAGVKKIIYRRGMPKPIRDTWLNRYLFGKVVTDVIVNSEEIGRSLVKNNTSIIDRDKVHLVYNGVNFDHYDDFDGIPVIKRQAGEFILGTTGRLVDQKNQLMLVNVVAGLKASGFPVKLYIAGTGPLEEDLRVQITSHGLDDDIILLGFIDDTRALLKALDIFVFPSRYEGSANAIVEAMAMGLPVVAYEVSSMPEMVEDGVTGLLAPYESEDGFRKQVERLLQDEELRKSMGRAGRTRAETRFSHARNMERVLEMVLG